MPVTPNPAALDTVGGTPVQLGADLAAVPNRTDMLFYAPMDLGPNLVDICVHLGELYAVTCRPNSDGNGRDTGTGQVRVWHWSGTMWEQVGGDVHGTDVTKWCGYDGFAYQGSPRAPSRPCLMSDGTDLFVSYIVFRGYLFPGGSDPVSFAPQLELKVWNDPDWECVGWVWGNSGPSAGAAGGGCSTRGDVEPDFGTLGSVVWSSMTWGFDDMLIVNSLGEVYSAPIFENSWVLMAQGGTPMICYHTGGTSPDIVTWDIRGAAEIARVSRDDLVDPTVVAGGVLGNPCSFVWREDLGLYYVLGNKTVFTVSADGTEVLPLVPTVLDNSYVKDYDANDSSAGDGFVLWDDFRTGEDDPQLVVFDGNDSEPSQGTGASSDAFVFQRQCQKGPRTWLRSWDFSGDSLLPYTIFGSLPSYGQPRAVWYQGDIVAIGIAASSGVGVSSKFQVWQYEMARDLFACPTPDGPIFRDEFVAEAGTEAPPDLTPPAGVVFTQTPSWRGGEGGT